MNPWSIMYEHLLRNFQERVQSFICPICHKNLRQKSKYDVHSHIVILSIDVNYTTYKFRSGESMLKIMMNKHSSSEMVQFLVQEKFALESLFPGLDVPVKYRSSDASDEYFSKFGNPSGVSLYEEVRPLFSINECCFLSCLMYILYLFVLSFPFFLDFGPTMICNSKDEARRR